MDNRRPEANAAHDGQGPGRALEPRDDPFALLVEGVLDYGIFMLSPEGIVSSWNRGAERMKGFSAGEIIGKHFSVFYPPDVVAAGKCDLELEIAAREGRFEEEGWRVRKDGTRFWANVVLNAVRGPDGRLLGFAKVTRDLTARRTAESALRQSEERMRLLISSVKDYAIFILDPTGHVATWNPGARRLKGYEEHEIVGQHFSRFYPEEDVRAGKCERELEEAQADGRFEDEGWRVRKDGSMFWANVVITPIREPDGQLVGFAKITRDLSERRRHEEERLTLARVEEARFAAERNEERLRALATELRDARDRAEEGTRIKDEFLATVSHELRTPLNAILGWSRMLQVGTLTPEKRVHAVNTIVRNATAQNQLIDDLLDVSRIIAGQLRLDVDVVDLNQVVAAALEVVRPAAEAKEIAFRWTLAPDAGRIRGDAGRLQQVFWNLLSNAVKFTPRGGHVDLTSRRSNGVVEVEITDSGKGISPAFLGRIFDRFTQEESTHTRTAGGFGLGLAIVKHLTELHGGSVSAHSDGEGKGASFVVRIPFLPIQPSAPEPPPRVEPSVEMTFPPELEGLQVLVIDDERDARDLVQAILERGGALVTLASSKAEAMESIRAHKPDVIISDIGMPVEDGYAFIRALRALPREEGGRTPAIALTAYARAEDRTKALLAGFQNHAAKPIEPQELLVVVANLAGRFA